METPSIYAPIKENIQTYEINDIRTPVNFKTITFSNYKKNDVMKELIESMKKMRLENSAYWAAELICAGHYNELWETILHYASKYIHLGNPKIAMYLDMRYNMFRELMNSGNYMSILQLRNNQKMRKLFAEIISVLAISNKKPSFEPIRISRVEEFDMTHMTERLKAPHTNYIDIVFRAEDPTEVFIPMNEFAFNLSLERKNMVTACYWIEWVIEFDIFCRKNKQPLQCERRTNLRVEHKYQRDIIWIIWDILCEYSEKVQIPVIAKTMNSLFNLFCIHYTTGSSKKRRYLIYFAVAMLTETVSFNIDVVANKHMVQNIVDNINEIYKQIKETEDNPGTDYLFSYMEKQNVFEQSLKQMEALHQCTITQLKN